MREQEEQIAVALNVIDPSTGQVFGVSGNRTTTSRYYSIKNLNFKGSIMDLFSYQEKLCKSSKDISMFKHVLYNANKYNEFRVNISEFSKSIDVSRQRLTKFLADAVAIGFMRKSEVGVYIINPFTFKSKVSNNELIETAQYRWKAQTKGHT